MTATERNPRTTRAIAPFDPASRAHRVASRLLPGFASLPTPVLVALERHAPLFDPACGPLGLDDRAAIATAVLDALDDRSAGARRAAQNGRTAALAEFTRRVLGHAPLIAVADLERALHAGLTGDEVEAAAETAIAYHLVARLALAASSPVRDHARPMRADGHEEADVRVA